jgi:hypothetical protein
MKPLLIPIALSPLPQNYTPLGVTYYFLTASQKYSSLQQFYVWKNLNAEKIFEE